ncbi:uncharacterized protein LOC144665420 [Oculina patagonica]
MKCTFLILAVMFLVFDYSWAKEKDADKFLLDENHANSFLVQKRNYCRHVQKISNKNILINQNVKEECCKEGCDTEEMAEIYGGQYQNPILAEDLRIEYIVRCCY